MLEALQLAFVQRALAASVLIGAVCAVVGVYVVLRGLAFIGAGISHASFGGVALGVALGLNPLATAIVFCVAPAWGIGLPSRRGRVREDTAIGIFFAATMALGVVLIGLRRGYSVDLFGYLFGSVLAITKADLWMALGLGLGVLALVALLFKEFLFLTFDPEMAAVAGLPVRALHFLLLTLVAVTVVVSIKVVGIILASALLVTPAATAYQLTSDFRRMMALSALAGIVSAIAGLALSYVLDTPSGATMVLVATALFFLASWLSPRRRARRSLPGGAQG